MTSISDAVTLRFGRGVAATRLRRYLWGMLLWASWWTIPALSGVLLKMIFDAITDGSTTVGVMWLLAVLSGVEVARLGVFYVAISTWGRWWAYAQAVLRTNLLHSQVRSGGPAAGPVVRSAGTAVTVFRDDVQDTTEYVDSWADLTGTVGFGVFALAVMFAVDALITLVVLVPLAVVFVVNRVLADRIRRVRLADREATSRVTGFLGDAFAAVLAVKVGGAEDRAVHRLRELNQARLATSVRDKVLTDGLNAFNSSTVDVTVGRVLLMVAGKMRAGTFTVGDLALFATYLSWLAGLPRWVGLVLARHRHAQVSIGRMAALLPGNDALRAVQPRALDLDRVHAPQLLAPLRPVAPASVRLRGFGVVRPDGTGVSGIDLDLPPGSFTVVTGKVGAGKTTLLRGLLGLEPSVTGVVEWDGVAVEDLAAHMIPPRCAYVAQVPTLFSATLRDNITLGRHSQESLLVDALRVAALDADVADMPAGLDTLVGPRGVRLSGGQLQRAATARALATGASLLVFDDLSSALDSVTEQALWRRLLSGRGGAPQVPTVVAVSHRAAALAHADQVVHMEHGRIVGVGTPAELRSRGLDPLVAEAAG